MDVPDPRAPGQDILMNVLKCITKSLALSSSSMAGTGLLGISQHGHLRSFQYVILSESPRINFED